MTKVLPERLDGAAAGCAEPAVSAGASVGAAAAPTAPKSMAAKASNAPMTVTVRGLLAPVCWSLDKFKQPLGMCGSRPVDRQTNP